MGSSSKVTVGHWYKLGVHAVFCHGPVDAVLELRVGERSAWTGNVTSNSEILIDKPSLFGGKKREGGVKGIMDVMFGGASQGANACLGDVHGPDGPGYRGLLSVVFRGADTMQARRPFGQFISIFLSNFGGFTWSAMNPYLKPFWQKVRHITTGRPWYPEKAAIATKDMNPAHIIWDAMTNTLYGLAIPEAKMDDAAFRAAADKLYTEGFGISLEWKSSMSAWDFIQTVLDHITGIVYVDPASGKFTIGLIRDDYVVGDLMTLDTSNIVQFTSFERATWGEITNTITVTYTNPVTEKPADVTVHNIAALRNQGGQVISSTVELLGIRSQALAQRIAQRDLKVFSTPLAKVSLELNRIGYNLRPGNVVKLDWPPLGITGMVLRVTNVEYGTLTDGRIKVDLAEDVFGISNTSYMEEQDDLWVNPSGPPQVITEQRAMEASFYEVNRAQPPSIIADFDPAFGFAKVLAVRPEGIAIDYDIAASATVGGDYTMVSDGVFVPTGRLGASIGPMDTVWTVTNLSDFNGVEVGTVGYINGEAFSYEGYDDSNDTFVVKRGILDTVPVSHASNSRIYFDVDQLNVDETERLDGETVYYKLLTSNGQGTVDASLATAVSVTLDQRYQRPYPPANVKLGDAYYPVEQFGPDLPLTWVHRDRLQQTVGLVGFTEGSIGPEAGTSYSWEVVRVDTNAVVGSGSGVTGTSTTINASYRGDVKLRLWSVRDGLASMQRHELAFTWYPEPRATETNDERITETGELRVTEN